MPVPVAMVAAMAIPSVIGIVGSLFSSHEAKKQQEELQKQSQASQAQQQQFLAPYLQNSQAQLAQAQQMCFGMSQATMGNGLNPAAFMQGQGGGIPGGPGQYPGFMQGYPQQQAFG